MLQITIDPTNLRQGSEEEKYFLGALKHLEKTRRMGSIQRDTPICFELSIDGTLTAVEVKLTHTINIRQRFNKSSSQGLRYQILQNVSFTNTNRTRVFDVLKTLAIENDQINDVTSADRPRIIKEKIANQAFDSSAEFLYGGDLLRTKPIVTEAIDKFRQTTWITQRKLFGSTLKSFLKTDRSDRKVLGLGSERLTFIIRLLAAYKEQVFDRHIIHGDLNDNNILFDSIDNSIKIIDYETASYKDSQKRIYHGHCYYVSPELLKSYGHVFEKDNRLLGVEMVFSYDMFALGRLVAQILGEDLSNYNDQYGFISHWSSHIFYVHYADNYGLSRQHKLDKKNLYAATSWLTLATLNLQLCLDQLRLVTYKLKLIEILRGMTDEFPEKRWSIEQVLREFTALRDELSLKEQSKASIDVESAESFAPQVSGTLASEQSSSLSKIQIGMQPFEQEKNDGDAAPGPCRCVLL